MALFAASIRATAAQSSTLPFAGFTAAAASPRRAKIYDIILGVEGAPADNIFTWSIQRQTTAGTSGSAITPQTLDPADTLASTIVVGAATYGAGPSLTSNAFLLTVELNQRATFRFVAAPNGELVIPATANNGMSIMTLVGQTLAAGATVHFNEL